MAIIKENGTISWKSDVQSGMSQNGNPWYRQTVVMEVAGYNGSFRKVALQASGNVVGDLEKVQIGDKVEFSYQVTAREYNGKWYNNVDLYKVLPMEPVQPVATPAYPQNPQYPQFPQMQTPKVNAQHAHRGRPMSTPQIPQNTPMSLQDGDLPAEFFQ